ncbi:TonB-dependent receptor plug domain-containing protein [Psychroflexus tropicus]|uniref:TonB-dependent receptor plug domain-containing protein n=1 Tax=Psychroflexus tropicus TaxID=197345 RepID=UPI00038089FF|nr:TonB-dependent receptor plug domain-containing protein [Psychroflexus tropicus]
MMNKDNFCCKPIFIALLILFGYSLQAQSGEKIELIELLDRIEEDHTVNFNYLSEDLDNLYVEPPPERNSLEQSLEFIKLQFPLEFIFVTNKSISIAIDSSKKCISFIDANSGSSISNVVVQFNSSKIASSNAFGKVFLEKSISLNDIVVTHPNYLNRQGSMDNLNDNNCISIYLYPEIELDEVIIKEYLAKGISLNLDNSLKIIPQEFGVLPGLINADVLHSLQYVPGIVNTDETIAQINVRGGTHDQNLVLWNGSRMYQTGHFFGMISAINPLMNHEIKVFKNGSSAFYNEGVSSVIDISSREHSQDYKRTLQLDFLSANASALLMLNKKSNLQVAARKSLTEVWDSPTYDGFTDKVFQNTEIQDLLQGDDNKVTTEQELQFVDVSLQYDYEFKEGAKLNLDVLAIQNKLTFDEVLETTLEQKRNDFEQSSFLANLSFEKEWSENHTSSVAFNASIYDLEAFNQSVLNDQTLLQNNGVVDLKLSLKDTYILSDLFTLRMGYQLNEVGVRNNSIVNSPEVILRDKQVLVTHSGIGELDYTSGNRKLKTKLGIRGNYYDDYGDFRLEPRFNLSFQANRHWRWNLLGEIKNQSLTQVIDQQQDFLGVEKRRWVLANEDSFPILNNLQLEAGVNYTKNAWMLQANVYHKTVERISSGSQGFQNQLEFLQINGDYEVLGAEVLIQKRINDFNFWINFSVMDNEYDFRTFEPQQFANNFEITQSSAFGASYTSNSVQLSVGGRYFAGRPITEIDLESPILTPNTNPRINFLNPNEGNLEDYFQVNFTASYQFDLKHSLVKTGFSLLNVFNSNNITQQFYRLEDVNTRIENVRVRSLALTPNAFISIQF